MKRFFSLLIVCLTYLFLYIPIVVLIVFSFNSKGFPSPWDHFTLQWYRQLFQSGALWESFLNSLIVATSSTALCAMMGITLLFFKDCGGKIDRSIGLFYGNLVVPETVLGISLLGLFSLLSVPLGLVTVVISHTVLGLGFVVPIFYLRYRQIDLHLKEASLALGASTYQTFRKITLPLMRPSIFATSLLIFIISFDDFILAYFTIGPNTQTLSIHLFGMIRAGISPTVNALSAFLLLLSSSLVMLFFSPKIRSRIF